MSVSPLHARVLIVDDDVATIRLMADALTGDYDIIIATTAQDGLHQAKQAQPDLILLDVVMPKIDGFALCKQLKSMDSTHRIPIIFVSALDAVNQQTKGFELGAVDYITKPVDTPILRARVQTHTRLYRQARQLESLAATDPLTGMANRRKFDEAIELELDRSQRNLQPLSLLIIDIDDFKAYNDFYGHGKGDDCLIAVARILLRSARRGIDLVSRLGGEEFGIILSDTDAAGARQRAEYIVDQFREARLPHAQARQRDFLTVSIGVLTARFDQVGRPCPPCRELIDSADSALYKAKAAGRNGYFCQQWPDNNN